MLISSVRAFAAAGDSPHVVVVGTFETELDLFSNSVWVPARTGQPGGRYHHASDGQGLSQLRQAPRVRQLAEPLDGRHPAALQPEPAEGADPGAERRDCARLRLRPVPEEQQGHQGRIGTLASLATGG